jgi:hypothetical protein
MKHGIDIAYEVQGIRSIPSGRHQQAAALGTHLIGRIDVTRAAGYGPKPFGRRICCRDGRDFAREE